MAVNPRARRGDSLRFLLVGAVAAWVTVAGVIGCKPEESPQGLAETPTVATQISPSPTPSPTPVPASVMEPVSPPEGAEFPETILELLSELELAGDPLVVAEPVGIPLLCDAPGGGGEATWSIARISVGETSDDAGYCLLGSLPGVYVHEEAAATIEGGEVLNDGRVRFSSMEQLSDILQDGALVYAADGLRFAVPIYVAFPHPQSIKDGIDESRMIPVPDFCTQERPLLRWLVIDEAGEAFVLDGNEYLDAVYGDTEIIIELGEGEEVLLNWENGTYVRVLPRGSTEDLFVGLSAPEEELPAMVEVATTEDAAAWWQAYGVRDANGRVLQVRIEEESYLDDRGHEVQTFKVVGAGGVVWMRVFANVPRQPTGEGYEKLVFVSKVRHELAVRYGRERGKTSITSLLFIPTAEQERSGIRPILKTANLRLPGDTPQDVLDDPTPLPFTVVRPFLWKEGDRRAQEIDRPRFCRHSDELPRSLEEIQGVQFDDALASWMPYVDRQTVLLILDIARAKWIAERELSSTLACTISYVDQETVLQIVEMWRAGVRNEVPLGYVDGDYVPPEHRRDDWGDLPHQMVEQALDTLVEAVRRTPNLDSEKRGFLRDLFAEVRTVRIRGTWGGGPYLDECGLGCSTYDELSETVYLAFYEGEKGISQLRLSTELYSTEQTQANRLIASLPTLDMILHEAEHGVVHLDDIDAEHRIIYQKEVGFNNWLAQVFSDEFTQARPEVRDRVQGHILWIEELAGQ